MAVDLLRADFLMTYLDEHLLPFAHEVHNRIEVVKADLRGNRLAVSDLSEWSWAEVTRTRGQTIAVLCCLDEAAREVAVVIPGHHLSRFQSRNSRSRSRVCRIFPGSSSHTNPGWGSGFMASGFRSSTRTQLPGRPGRFQASSG